AGQVGILQVVGQILLAGEEPYERSSLLRDVVADRAAQHRIGGLERVKDRALRRLTVKVERHLVVDMRERPQMRGKHDSNHTEAHDHHTPASDGGSAWTLTDSTARR